MSTYLRHLLGDQYDPRLEVLLQKAAHLCSNEGYEPHTAVRVAAAEFTDPFFPRHRAVIASLLTYGRASRLAALPRAHPCTV